MSSRWPYTLLIWGCIAEAAWFQHTLPPPKNTLVWTALMLLGFLTLVVDRKTAPPRKKEEK